MIKMIVYLQYILENFSNKNTWFFLKNSVQIEYPVEILDNIVIFLN